MKVGALIKILLNDGWYVLCVGGVIVSSNIQ